MILGALTAKREQDYDDEKAKLALAINSLDAAIKNGDKAQYLQGLQNAKSSAEVICSIRKDTLCNLANTYINEHDPQKTKLLELISIQATTNMLRANEKSDTLTEINHENVAAKLLKIAKNYQDYSNNLKNLELNELKDLRDQLVAYGDNVSRLASEASVCVSICDTNSMAAKERQLDELMQELEIRDEYVIESSELRKELNKE